MNFPAYYAQIEPIRLYDPLGDFLGAIEGGHIAIDFGDCVRVAGHACPTVAGAYRMAQEGLRALYPDPGQLPVRSNIRVEIREAETAGVAGVTGAIIGCITGAGGAGGFKGIGDRFARNDRLIYGVDLPGDVRLTCLESDASVTLRYDPSVIPGDPQMKPLMLRALHGDTSPEETEHFRRLWHARTEAILTAEDPTPFLTLHKDTP